eukprot:GFUD01038572.1.p1 GENE.GFUD01038572.1~~GFUD01038572.1.p1  ORF type:complete len:158 (-),score=50.03 GFUD01038572.1:100-510(-)
MAEMEMETDQMNLMQQMSQMNITHSLPSQTQTLEQDMSNVTSAVNAMSVGQDHLQTGPVYLATAQQQQQQHQQQALEQMQQIQLQQHEMLRQQKQQLQDPAHYPRSLQHPCSDQFSMCPHILKRANLIPMQDYSVM